ncbi:MAG: YbjN domain-containing protein, partial [Pseudomonadota bacterium]
AGFDFADAQDESVAAEWNYNRFTKAYLDKEGDPFIQLPVNILHGITPANFEDTLVWFTNEMGAFMDHIGWYDQETEDPTTRIDATPT